MTVTDERLESALEPSGYLHEILEPDCQQARMYSATPDNPWAHWCELHRDRCTYRCTPLYAIAALQRAHSEAAAQWEARVAKLEAVLEDAPYGLAEGGQWWKRRAAVLGVNDND